MRRALIYCILFFCCCAAPWIPASAETVVPRTVIALYDGSKDSIPNSYIHLLAEMPLNHLGLTVEYHDIRQPLPDIASRKDVRGVLTWFMSNTHVDPRRYLEWAINAMDSGKKYVVLGSLGVPRDSQNYSSSLLLNRFLGKIGVRMTEQWVENPFTTTYEYKTSSMFAESHPYDWIRPAYAVVQPVGSDTQVHLIAHGGNGIDSALMVTSPAGGYIAADYLFRSNERNDDDIYQWLIDPLEFFRAAFGTDAVPKPDITTIAGRRIYESHIDGDGWNNVTRIEEYRGKSVLSSEVIMDKVIKPNPDLPVTVTVIAADIDPKWGAVTGSRAVAKAMFALPQVEAGTHTYTHPFYWQIFEGADGWKNEVPYLRFYTHPVWTPTRDVKNRKPSQTIPAGYKVPRAYANQPFNLDQEIEGSVKELTPLLPPGKRIEILTWSGNCLPWADVVRRTRLAGLQNINGGDSRADPEYPGYASLAPIGREVGGEHQIYASSSNENTYTDLWSENFHAYAYLQKTLQNTETPIRLKPLGIYYHFYSGEREASLNALLENIAYAKTQDIAPVTASHYARIAEGFYTTNIVSLAPDTWRIENRGDLQTIRFDHATLQAVDFQSSKGVIGERHFQGSLYVYLDKTVNTPVIALKTGDRDYAPEEETAPYLVDSRWLIYSLSRRGNQIDFTAQGFGAGDMVWQVPKAGRYRISINGRAVQTIEADNRLLRLALKYDAIKPMHITITALSGDVVHA